MGESRQALGAAVVATTLLVALCLPSVPAAADPVSIRPGAVEIVDDFDGMRIARVPVSLSAPSSSTVTVDWATASGSAPGYAESGVDFVAGSGRLSFAPGQTARTVGIQVIGDTVVEPPLLGGEWALVSFSDPTNATIDTANTYFGKGVVVILDQRPTTTARFDHTGAPQSWTVPPGVGQADAVACGAEGADLYFGTPFGEATGEGGLGGQATAEIPVTPGEQLQVNVGGDGDSGGWNGGGSGSASGGGASDLRQGGTSRADRVLVGGGGGGGGGLQDSAGRVHGLDGGAGGGLVGEHGGSGGYGGSGGTQTSGHALGQGGSGRLLDGTSYSGGGGGGGFWGGGGGGAFVAESIGVGAGGGGSGFGDAFRTGVCDGHGWVELTYTEPPKVLPGAGMVVEGDAGTTTLEVPVTLSSRTEVPVTVDWTTVYLGDDAGLAQPSSDFIPGSGTVTFAPGETLGSVSVEIVGDLDDEPPLLYGEWGVIAFSNPANATVDTGYFFGAGLFVIVDDD